ncbi:MAG: universal stress protein [Burkholderiales bacterium]
MKLLVAIDGSDNSLRALAEAVRLAGQLKAAAELVLVNAHDDIAFRGPSQFVGKQAVDEYLAELADQELKAAVGAAQASGLMFSVSKVRGHVSEAILQVAGSEHVDMIVMGSKGRSALRDLLVGSVAQHVLSRASVPVLLVM